MGFQNGVKGTVLCHIDGYCCKQDRQPPILNAKYSHTTKYKMGVLCLAREAFIYAGVYARKYTGQFLCLTVVPGSFSPLGIRFRRYSQGSSVGDVREQFVCHHLPHRTILKIKGQDTSPFLQGIITNDMALLEEPGRTAMYSHMLNVQGRTLFDILLYRYGILHTVCTCA